MTSCGGVVDFLKEKRLYDSSVIAIVGDHNPHVMADSDYTPVPFLILNYCCPVKL